MKYSKHVENSFKGKQIIMQWRVWLLLFEFSALEHKIVGFAGNFFYLFLFITQFPSSLFFLTRDPTLGH